MLSEKVLNKIFSKKSSKKLNKLEKELGCRFVIDSNMMKEVEASITPQLIEYIKNRFNTGYYKNNGKVKLVRFFNPIKNTVVESLKKTKKKSVAKVNKKNIIAKIGTFNPSSSEFYNWKRKFLVK